jgi:hypothetical protein
MLQGSKCLKDICRPVAVPDGGHRQHESAATHLFRAHGLMLRVDDSSPGHGRAREEKCFLGRVCETGGKPVEVRSFSTTYPSCCHYYIQYKGLTIVCIHAQLLGAPINAVDRHSRPVSRVAHCNTTV